MLVLFCSLNFANPKVNSTLHAPVTGHFLVWGASVGKSLGAMASTYWDMRLSVACAATNAEFQNRLMAETRPSTSSSWSDSPTPIPTA